MLMQLVVGIALLVVPVLIASLVSLAAGNAKRRGVQVQRIMREGPWHTR